jgi:WD40 repeat protein
VASGEEIRRLKGRDQHWCVAFSSDGELIAAGAWWGVIEMWDATTGRPRPPIQGRREQVRAIAFTKDSRHILAFDGPSAALYEVATGRRVRSFDGHSQLVRSLCLSSDETRLVTGAQDGRTKIWDMQTGQEMLSLLSEQDEVWTVDLSPDNRWIGVCGRESTVMHPVADWSRSIAAMEEATRADWRSLPLGQPAPPPE